MEAGFGAKTCSKDSSSNPQNASAHFVGARTRQRRRRREKCSGLASTRCRDHSYPSIRRGRRIQYTNNPCFMVLQFRNNYFNFPDYSRGITLSRWTATPPSATTSYAVNRIDNIFCCGNIARRFRFRIAPRDEIWPKYTRSAKASCRCFWKRRKSAPSVIVAAAAAAQPDAKHSNFSSVNSSLEPTPPAGPARNLSAIRIGPLGVPILFRTCRLCVTKEDDIFG